MHHIRRTIGIILTLIIISLFVYYNFIRRRWDFIIVHHSATKFGNVNIFYNGHKARGGAWLGNDPMLYHLVIGNGQRAGDGELQAGGRWLRQQLGGGCSSVKKLMQARTIRDFFRAWSDYYNFKGIHICLVGDLDSARPSPRQMDTLTNVVEALCRRYRIQPWHIMGHREAQVSETACPGKRFPLVKFKEDIAQRLRQPSKVNPPGLFNWKIRLMNFWPLMGFFFGEFYYSGLLLIMNAGLAYLFFRIALPLARTTAPAPPIPEPEEIAEQPLLVVEPNIESELESNSEERNTPLCTGK